MKKFVLFLVVVACFFVFVACAPSEDEKRAEAEKRIWGSGQNKNSELRKAEDAIYKQLLAEEKEREMKENENKKKKTDYRR